jgi:hypothetical protein
MVTTVTMVTKVSETVSQSVRGSLFAVEEPLTRMRMDAAFALPLPADFLRAAAALLTARRSIGSIRRSLASPLSCR